MTEVILAEHNQEVNKAKSLWDCGKFSSLMKYDPKAAAQYAIDCGVKTAIYGIPVEEYVKGKTATEEVVEDTIDDEIEITSDDLKELLKANDIKFHHALGYDKLMNLAKENELI